MNNTNLTPCANMNAYKPFNRSVPHATLKVHA
jgi:hypothetical protein